MNSVLKTIKLDLYSPTSYEVIKTQQGDKNSRVIEFDLYNQGKPYDFSSNTFFRFVGHRGDGSSFSKTEEECITRNGSHVSVTLTEDILYYAGIIEAKLVMYESPTSTAKEKVLSTIPFKISCIKNPCNENELSAGEYSIVTDLIFQVKEFSEKAQDVIDNAANSAANAKKSEDAAKASQTAAKASETNAKTSEENAKTSEINAASSKAAADASATNADTYAKKSESYAHGGTNTRPNEDTDNAMAYAQNAKEYADSWKGSLLPQGSVTFSQLPTSGNVKGHMYNVNEAFVTDSRFKEGAGFSYPAGTNVYWTSDGKWDCLSGVLTKEVTQAEYDALPEAEKMSGTIYYISDADNTLGSATDTVPGVVVVDKALSDTSENPVQNKVVKAAIDLKANLASPALTGTPTAPTPSQSSNGTRIATTGFVKTVINALVDGAPETLDTLKEIADALAENETVVSALNAAIGNKVDKVSGKGLSANDFTDAEKSKLAGVDANANNYSLPLASSSTRGGVKTGYSQNGKNYPVQLSNEQMYVNVPWTDTQIITGVKGNAESTYRSGNVNLTPANIGLGNVNNTADIDKLVSRANRMFMPRVAEDPSDMTVYDTANFVVREYPYTGNTQTGLPSGYFYHILTGRSPDEKYATQLALGMTIGELYYRNMFNGTWSEWKKIFNSGNISTVTPANIGAFPSSGGTLSGALTVTGDTTLQGNVRIKKASSGYGSVINIGDGDYIRISEETDDILTVKAKQININSSNANAVYINGQMALRYKKLTQSEYDALSSTKNSDNVLYFITN